jgi:hypothetical protein
VKVLEARGVARRVELSTVEWNWQHTPWVLMSAQVETETVAVSRV